jgi:hypothetical protein
MREHALAVAVLLFAILAAKQLLLPTRRIYTREPFGDRDLVGDAVRAGLAGSG